MRNLLQASFFFLFSGAAGCSGDTSEVCDASTIQAALDAAGSGESVAIGACPIHGSLTVPSGVTLMGGVVVASGNVGVMLTPGEMPSILDGVQIEMPKEGGARVGVLVRGVGAAVVRNVRVSAERGVALGIDGVTTMTIENTELAGPVTTDNATESRFVRVTSSEPSRGECPAGRTCDCTPGDVRSTDGSFCDASGRWATLTAGYGLFADSSNITIDGLDVHGFAQFGAVFRDATVVWENGMISENLGIGIRQSGGSLTLTNVDVVQTLAGLRGDAPMAVAITAEADLTTTNLTVSGNDQYGVVQLSSIARHTGITASDNGDAGVWAGEGGELTLSGHLEGNEFAGVVASDVESVTLDGGDIVGTRPAPRVFGMTGMTTIGDGFHVALGRPRVVVSNFMLAGNGRAGLVADLGAGEGSFTFTNVVVDGMGDQLGAIAGHLDGSGHLVPVEMGTWDMGIERRNDTIANDISPPTRLDAVRSATPTSIPNPLEEAGAILPMF